jgi:hypothetical protein
VSDYPECSAKGCRTRASWVLVWNNPKLHAPEYEKRWLACDEHRGSLAGFLELRRLLRHVHPLPSENPPQNPPAQA